MTEPRVSDGALDALIKSLRDNCAQVVGLGHETSGGEAERLLDALLDLRDARNERDQYEARTLAAEQGYDALRAERDEARRHVRDHHLEPCESCAATESERDVLKAEHATLVLALERCLGELRWCSGSSDFGEGGKAHKGWLVGPVPAMEASSAALALPLAAAVLKADRLRVENTADTT